MNTYLCEQIVRHVLSNFRIIPSKFVNVTKTDSLINKEFALLETLSFDNEGTIITNHIWGVQLSAGSQEIKILLGDCSIDPNIPEFCLMVQLKDAPVYGLYLVYNDLINKTIDSEAMIAYNLDSKGWLECGTFLQATFLAGMEQLKDIGFAWSKCSNYKPIHQAMLSFIKFHSELYEAEDEGQED
jgi:hypothetical protein